MKRIAKILVAFMLSFSVIFTAVGYAALSDTLEVAGSAGIAAQTGVFISDVIPPASGSVTVNSYASTLLNTKVDLGSNKNAKLTLQLKFYNNSAYVYVFDSVKYTLGSNGTYDNANIKFEVSGMKAGDKIEAQSELTCSLTFSYDNTSSISDTDLNSVLNFYFVPAEEYRPVVAVDNALHRFEAILNSTEDFKTLTNQMDAVSGSWWSGRNDNSYIGNVVGSSSADSNVLNNLFTVDGDNKLTLVIDNEKTNVTAMIKRKDIDGKSSTGDENGYEMAIYMTGETISSSNRTPVTYVAVYTKDSGSDSWYLLGQMFEGEANANGYTGGWGYNSINTETWTSTKAYYEVSTDSSIEEVIAGYLKTK